MNMLQVFKVGDEIYGYCGGYFGRDSYEDKTCIFVDSTCALFKDTDGCAFAVNIVSAEGDLSYFDGWKDKKNSYDEEVNGEV